MVHFVIAALIAAIVLGATPTGRAYVRMRSSLLGWTGGVMFCLASAGFLIYSLFSQANSPIHLSGVTYGAVYVAWIAVMSVSIVLSAPALVRRLFRTCINAS
jgi:hypothetical protein